VRTPGALAALGLPGPFPDRAQWPAFQAAGERLAAAGHAGVLSCSAARPSGASVCVFAQADALPGVTPAAGPERLHAAPPPPGGVHTDHDARSGAASHPSLCERRSRPARSMLP
jgi:hypothetical protein